ncbi:MAG: UTP--glucose-1-phosphate uridylyltransferase GalU [Bdellovibrionales bacterium]
MKIRKAVIPAAGLGTRFLPATKTIPKEMLPIVDKPTILYNVEEIIAADIPEVVLIAGRDKTSIEDFFDTSYELEKVLDLMGKRDLLNPIRDIRKRIKVISIRQQEALGLGHAILCAEPVVGKEPFAVLLGDEIMITKPGKKSAIAQLAELYDKTGTSVVAVMEVSATDVTKYGIVDVKPKGENLWTVNSVVEKPAADKAPSRLALPGRYIFDSEIFNCMREIKPGRNGEIQLSDGMTLLAQRRGMIATTVDARRFDAGDKLGFLQANVELALHHPEVGEAFQKYIKDRFGGKI